MIGDSPLVIDTRRDNITIKWTVFKGTEVLWEILTLKNVNKESVNKNDLKTYKKILIMRNAQLTRYQPGDNINITRGKKFPDEVNRRLMPSSEPGQRNRIPIRFIDR